MTDLDRRLEHALECHRLGEDIAALLRDVLDISIEIAGTDIGTLHRYDSSDDCLKVMASRGFPDSVLKHFAIVRRDTNSTCAAALTRRMRVIANDLATSYLFVGTKELELLQEAGVAAAHSTPLISSSGRLWGVFTTHFREPQPEDSYDPAPLDRFARRAADWLEAIEPRPAPESGRRS